MPRPPSIFNGARWVWPAALGRPVNQYVEFRQTFDCPEKPGAVELALAADTVYAIWLNGNFFDTGRFPDVPPEHEFDRLAIGRAVKPGRNELVIGLHVQGADSFQHLPGEPGLIFAVKGKGVSAASGASTQWRVLEAYRSGEIPRITGQLGFTFEYNAARAPGKWRKITRTDMGAEPAALHLVPRPIPKTEVLPAIATTVVAQGLLCGAKIPDDPAAAIQHDAMAARSLEELFGPDASQQLPLADGLSILPEHAGADGFYVVVDLGREETGFVEFDIEAGEGAVVDIGHGEHLDDLRVRVRMGGRRFANRYVCRGGRQKFTHWYKRMAGRFLQFNVRGTRAFTLHYAGVRPAMLPLEVNGVFHAPDRRVEEIFSVSVRTLQLCMHEHYEDCPWREQALYANDGRNQALAGYYTFGEGGFPAASLELLGKGLKPDGWLEMCMPANIDITIPSFTFAWVLAVADHWLYHGDTGFVRRVWPVVKAVLDARVAEMRDGLLPCPAGGRYWQFYDWAPGLSGDERIQPGETRYDALLNMQFVAALQAVPRFAEACGARAGAGAWKQAAATLVTHIHQRFWDKKNAAYFSYHGDRAFRHYSELAQATAVLAGVAPDAKTVAALRAKLAVKTDWVETTLSQSLYKYQALLGGNAADQRAAFDAVATDWGAMLRRGATSFWETRRGADDFAGAGSLCHGWSALPAYLYGAHALGVRPVEPGFSTFSVAPAESGLASASGVVATPHGPIKVAWKRTARGFDGYVRRPAACKCLAPAGFQVVVETGKETP